MTFWIVLTFLCFFLTQHLVEGGLLVLNLRYGAHKGAEVPEALTGRVTPVTAARSLAYTQARGRLAFAQGLYGGVLTLAVLFSGALPALDALLTGWGLEGGHRFTAFLAILAAGLSLAHLPFSLVSTFGIEARFGFNRVTPALWLLDRVKGLLLAAVLGLPLLYAAHGFMAFTGPQWWLWLFGFLTAFQVLLAWLFPTVIAPLFNRYTPLPQGELKTRLEALAARASFRTRGLYVMDASRRSGHSNAYFTGFFRPRIVLFDTLVNQTPVEEALAVLAHEIGHFRMRHIHKRMAAGLASTLVMLWVLSLLIDWTPLYQAFGFGAPSFHAALALASLVGGSFTFFLDPLQAWLSRRHEYQADAYAAALTGQPMHLGQALVRLGDENLSNLHPHPWFSAWYYSHPTLVERLGRLGVKPVLAAE
ncbi:MAG: M48 family metallopeptidase [Deltaproteobacteria bacterium]|nr:M48 family metallopeptidase [Deltaproteobacteria bacterium]